MTSIEINNFKLKSKDAKPWKKKLHNLIPQKLSGSHKNYPIPTKRSGSHKMIRFSQNDPNIQKKIRFPQNDPDPTKGPGFLPACTTSAAKYDAYTYTPRGVVKICVDCSNQFIHKVVYTV